jgi:TRAP-type C4-dicarboxylate transport system substrate-binding protein
MTISKILTGLSALAFVAVAGASAAADTLRLQAATIANEGFPYVDGLRKFEEVLKARPECEIDVNVHIGGSLGNEREINEAILEGSVHLGIGAGSMANLAPIYNLFQIPFLIQGQDHMAAVADGPIGEEVAGLIEQQVNWFSTGDSPLETVKAPVNSPADLKGVKMRVIPNPALVDAMKAMGANPTPMAYGEVYTGLKQGVVEGAHLDVISVQNLKIFEAAKFMTDWDQITFLSEPRPVIMKAAFFDSLPAKQQACIREAVDEATAHERKVFLDKMTAIRGELLKQGVTITKVDVDAFLVKIRPVWAKYAKELGAEELVEKIAAAKP